MKLLTTRATFSCSHPPGRAEARSHRQGFVRVEGAHVLIGADPGGLPVRVCPLVPPNNKPCSRTFAPASGHSRLIRIDGVPVCLERIRGPTDGVPPGVYAVVDAGQELVDELEEGSR